MIINIGWRVLESSNKAPKTLSANTRYLYLMQLNIITKNGKMQLADTIYKLAR